jgi:hypothetical protein
LFDLILACHSFMRSLQSFSEPIGHCGKTLNYFNKVLITHTT